MQIKTVGDYYNISQRFYNVTNISMTIPIVATHFDYGIIWSLIKHLFL